MKNEENLSFVEKVRRDSTKMQAQGEGGYARAVMRASGKYVYLVRAKEQPSNSNAWYYIQILNAVKLPLFLERVKSGIDLSSYGTILYSGWGTEPPDEIKAEIAKRFEA